MKTLPTDDPVFGKGSIRADGRKIHSMLLLQAKSPAEKRYDWDYMRVVRIIPGDKAFRPMNPALCSLAAG
jgi:branched-chain amino acid transport system substrate-binding protein